MGSAEATPARPAVITAAPKMAATTRSLFVVPAPRWAVEVVSLLVNRFTTGAEGSRPDAALARIAAKGQVSGAVRAQPAPLDGRVASVAGRRRLGLPCPHEPCRKRARVPDRARLDGRGPGAGLGPLGSPDPAGGGELPDLGAAHRPGPDRRPGPDKGGGGRGERATPAGGQGRGGRPGRRRRRGGGRGVGRPVSGRRLPDRLRDLFEHEHERGAGP